MKRTEKEFYDWYNKEKWNIPISERQAWAHKAFYDWHNELEVGDRAHICHYSDISPVTVVRRTAKTITVRYDKASRSPNWKPVWEPGGFSAICTNIDEQEWIIEEDENGRLETFRLRQVGWRNSAEECLAPGWKKYYDYNF